ncbi:MAG TPA: DoxX family membrane protein [Bacteroidales bacterium]|nr:DoxX family membrane protein [Bacteroidales bacterium]
MYKSLTGTQVFFLILLRIAIGWHFLYEGLVKVFSPAWTSSGYLMDSKGFMAPIYKSIASNPDMLRIVDFLNEWGLVLIGIGLILGLFTRFSAIAGIILLATYYLSHPPVIGYSYALPSEGAYFIVDKILIELIALGVICSFPTHRIIGVDRLLFRKKENTSDYGRR